MFKRVLDLGWTVERFGNFDMNTAHGFGADRSGKKAERIGKKYQWIAFHEFLARAADNLSYPPDHHDESDDRYKGPWQFIHLRDIDPSCLLRKTARERWKSHQNTWWSPCGYKNWRAEREDETWLKASDDLPSAQTFLSVTGADGGSRWLTLEGFYRWTEPPPPGEDPYFAGRREIWYMLKSYLVRTADADQVLEWAKHQHFMGRWMPESRELTHVYLGEFFWSPAFQYYNVPFHSHDAWTRGHDNTIPNPILTTSEQYVWEEGGFDCSIDDTLSICFPCQLLVEEMRLTWNGQEGKWFDSRGELVAFDPPVRENGPGALLVRRNPFAQFLNERGYHIIWTLLGEKMVCPGISGRNQIGRLEISGVYQLRAGELQGGLTSRFERFPSR